MKKTYVIATVAFALVTIAPAAFAGSASGTLTVNANVNANCTISNATLDFLNYDPVGANAASPLDAATTMSVACTKNTDPKITTAAAGGSISGAGGTLNYLLFSDSGRTNSFVSPGFDMGPAPDKNGRTLNIYGRIPGGQDVGVGGYTGTISITVNF